MAQLYAGDLYPKDAYKMLQSDKDSALVDVRTVAEWHYVGLPNLKEIDKDVIRLEWRQLPEMKKNNSFMASLMNMVPSKETKLLFLCRTGGRSKEAAIEATAHGYSTCYNIADGFEGDLDNNFQRGLTNGWKSAKLPWRQD